VDVQDLANHAIALAAHHIHDPRPAEAPGTVPDDGTPGYAAAELRRLTYWSLEKSSTGPAVLAGLTAAADDPDLRGQAAQIFAADLQQFAHLLPAVYAFVARAWAAYAVPVGAPAAGELASMSAPPTTGLAAPAASPWMVTPPRPSGLQIGQRHLGWGVVAGGLIVLLLLAGGLTTAAIRLTQPAGPPDAPVAYRGSVEFGSFDLDHRPPTQGLGADVIGTSGPAFNVTNQATGVKYSDGATPTRAPCQLAVARDGVSGQGVADQVAVADPVRAGMVFCVDTRNGTAAYLKITATTDSTFTADVVIWGS
jgi:hypothetical protein